MLEREHADRPRGAPGAVNTPKTVAQDHRPGKLPVGLQHLTQGPQAAPARARQRRRRGAASAVPREARSDHPSGGRGCPSPIPARSLPSHRLPGPEVGCARRAVPPVDEQQRELPDRAHVLVRAGHQLGFAAHDIFTARALQCALDRVGNLVRVVDVEQPRRASARWRSSPGRRWACRAAPGSTSRCAGTVPCSRSSTASVFRSPRRALLRRACSSRTRAAGGRAVVGDAGRSASRGWPAVPARQHG